MNNYHIIPYPDPRFPNLGSPIGTQIGMTKSLIDRELDGNTPLGDGEGDNVVTINDTLFIPIKSLGEKGEDINSFLEKLQNKFGINLRSKEGLEKISRIYLIALNYFNEYLERNIPKVFLGKKLDSLQEIIDFIKSTSTFGGEQPYRQTYCSLSKIMFSILEIEKMGIPLDGGELINSFNSFIEEKYKKVHLRTSSGIIFGSIPKKLKNGENCSIYFQLENRAKNLNAIISKLLAKPDLSPQTAVNDFLGIRSITGIIRDALFLLEWEFINIYKRNPKDFRQKSFLSIEELNDLLEIYGDDLDSEFKEALTSKLRGKSRLKNNPDFQDIKFLGTISLNKKPYNVESQHFLSDNKNETGFANHKVLELFRKIEVVERLEGYVTSNYILRLIESFLRTKYGESKSQNMDILSEQIRTLFSPKNNNKIFSGFNRGENELTLDDIGVTNKNPHYDDINKLFKELKGIYFYLTSKLIKVSIKNQRSGLGFYKVQNRLLNQKREGILPDGVSAKIL